ncbi:acyltransferase domain-containing protein [Streptacidiphilus sp. 4-A2]|nr:acyltransferase domain-containing protein [Streptacidiphilus sp. 4-A2]
MPDAVLGHSQGEIAAAVVAGILTLGRRQGVALRSRALVALSGRGGMMFLAEPAATVTDRIAPWDGRISVARQRPGGDRGLRRPGGPGGTAGRVRARRGPGPDPAGRLRLARAAGGRHPRGGAAAAGTVAPRPGLIAMVSALTGEFLAGPELDADYWYASLRSTVEFARATEALGRAGYGVFVETSAHPVLTAAITETLEQLRAQSEGTLREPVVTGTLRRDEGGPVRALTSLAQVHGHGVFVDWTAVLPVAAAPNCRPTPSSGSATGPRRPRPRPRPRAAPFRRPRARSGARSRTATWTAWRRPSTSTVSGWASCCPLTAWRQRERGESTVADWRYRISWAPVTVPATATLNGTWLLVAPASGPGAERVEACLEALVGHGARVLLAEIPSGGTDRQQLADRIRATLDTAADASAGQPAGVVSLLALDDTPMPLWPVLTHGLTGTTGLVQALGDTGIGAPLWVLTAGAVAAGAGERLTAPLQAQTWALGRVVGLEHPERWGGLIDLPEALDERGGLDRRAAGRLAAVLACGEDQVAIRAGGVLGRRLLRAPRPRTGGRWLPGGSVLVTGGTGGVGGHVARWLTGRDTARLVLSSRSGPGHPARSRWPPNWPAPEPRWPWSPVTSATARRWPGWSPGSTPAARA